MDYNTIKKNEEVNALLKTGDATLEVLSYTDHSAKHASIVAKHAGQVLRQFGYSDHDIELAKIAGYMHDIGNAVNRNHHAEYGAILAGDILRREGMELADRMTIMAAIGNHDESTGGAVDAVSAALIIADKTDVRRSRVRENEKAPFDIHDQVNYAVTESKLEIDPEKKVLILNLKVDEQICTMYEYFEIFLGRMLMCRRAAEMLGAKFELMANGSKIL